MPDAYTQPGREWWAQRWIDVLESFGYARRLARARVYARQGNVLSLDFKKSTVTASVQGTAADPYRVSISLDPFSDQQWGYVIESMAERAIFSAKLLAGEMPQNIEEVFTANGLSLFPFTKFDIHSRCSCPDPANPCKHIGAVYYLLGDRFSEDPFVLFQLRGRSKDQIIDALRQYRSSRSSESEETPTLSDTPPASALPATPLQLDNFWQYGEELEPSLVVITPSPSSETVLDVLGPIPFKTEAAPNMTSTQEIRQAAMTQLKHLYAAVSQQAILIAMQTESDAK